MTILHVIRCEQYEECKQQIPIETDLFQQKGGHPPMPEPWLTLFQGDLYKAEAHHFCSEYCLMRWYVVQGRCVPVPGGA